MKKTIDYHLNQIENLVSKARKVGHSTIVYEFPNLEAAKEVVRRLNDTDEYEAKIIDLEENLIGVKWK